MTNANTTPQNAQNADNQQIEVNSGTHNGFTFAPFEKMVQYSGRNYTEKGIRVMDGTRTVGEFSQREDMTIEAQIDWVIEDDIKSRMAKGDFKNTALVGMFVSERLWSDTNIVGKIVGTFGKTGITIEPMDTDKNTAKMEWTPGGFSGHCSNNFSQDWTFKTSARPNFGLRLGKGFHKNGYRVTTAPQHHHDFNF